MGPHADIPSSDRPVRYSADVRGFTDLLIFREDRCIYNLGLQRRP